MGLTTIAQMSFRQNRRLHKVFSRPDIDWTHGVSNVASITDTAFKIVNNIGHPILPLNGRFTKHRVKKSGGAKRNFII